MELFRRGFGYSFKDEQRFQDAINVGFVYHKDWETKGDKLLKDLVEKWLHFEPPIQKILQSNYWIGSVLIGIGLGSELKVARDLAADIKTLEKYHEKLQEKGRFSEAFYIPCYQATADSPVELLTVPKQLGNIFEALIYAIYIDCGEDKKEWASTVLSNLHAGFLQHNCIRHPNSTVNEMLFKERFSVLQDTPVFPPVLGHRSGHSFIRPPYFEASDDSTGHFVGKGRRKYTAKVAAAVAYLAHPSRGKKWHWLIDA